MANMGSFGNVSPDAMRAIKSAMARRQQGGSAPALDQQSAVSPTAAPSVPTLESGIDIPQGASQGAAPQGGVTNPEAELIIRALKDRLKAISSLESGGV